MDGIPTTTSTAPFSLIDADLVDALVRAVMETRAGHVEIVPLGSWWAAMTVDGEPMISFHVMHVSPGGPYSVN